MNKAHIQSLTRMHEFRQQSDQATFRQRAAVTRGRFLAAVFPGLVERYIGMQEKAFNKKQMRAELAFQKQVQRLTL